MEYTLQQLVERAKVDNSCSQGHDFQSVGGRACENYHMETCAGSQTVFQCARCGEYDYGYKGGPAHQECVEYCKLQG